MGERASVLSFNLFMERKELCGTHAAAAPAAVALLFMTGLNAIA